MSLPVSTLAPAPVDAPAPTPMMAQYLAVKAQYPDTLVFYRMGDFFELFFDDAVTASPILDIALTRRGKHGATEIPMCGVPAHAYESYLAKLIRAGHRVAICDQTETPEQAKARGGYKALVTRDVVRVVTPGTLTEETFLDARAPHYLAAVAQMRGQMGLAWLDLSTGAFHTQSVSGTDLSAHLARIAPREILVPEKLYRQSELSPAFALYDRAVTPQPDALFDAENAMRRLSGQFDTQDLSAFGTFTAAEVTAASVILDYAERTQKAAVMHIRPPQNIQAADVLHLDPATRRNLELTETLSGEKKGSLLSVIDQTATAPGARLLYGRLSAPLCTKAAITTRHDQIEFFLSQADLRTALRTQIRTGPDMERALARLSLSRGLPRDLAAIMTGLACAAGLAHTLNETNNTPAAVDALSDTLHQNADTQNLHDTLCAALSDDLPATVQDGNFIRAGHDPALDHHRNLRDNGRRAIAALQQKYAHETGIDTLKIAHNNILGYYIDVSARRADILFGRPDQFIHRQTLAGNVRFTTTELAGLERDLMEAGQRALAIELDLFRQLTQQVLQMRGDILRLAGGLAELDVALAGATIAAERNYTRPEITDDLDFAIEGGRHPVVEAALAAANKPFIANNTNLARDQFLWLITGPNMAGKSTVLRQNALIVIMAQMGFFVPAARARIGLVDRLFSRVGASDDLASGRSTFMVEMVETAAILNQASARSLVILDEIGRGTATDDGLAIAWATLEYLHDQITARALFATHYHELTELRSRLAALYLARMAVKEWQNEIVFLHEIEPGAAQGSYGIHVARLAGLPAAVTARAEMILQQLNAKKVDTNSAGATLNALPLFASTPAPATSVKPSAAEEKLRATNPDTLSPRAALDLIYELKLLAEREGERRE